MGKSLSRDYEDLDVVKVFAEFRVRNSIHSITGPTGSFGMSCHLASNASSRAHHSPAMAFADPAFFLCFAKSGLRVLDSMRPSAYGIFLVHYIFIIWLQYAVYDPPLPAVVKFAIVFTGTLSLSWCSVVLLRKIPAVARMI